MEGLYLHWDYEELFEAIRETYQEFWSEYRNGTQALARTLSEFEAVMNLGAFERSIILIAYGELLVTHSKVFHKSKEYLVNELENLNFEQVKDKATLEQLHDLDARKKVIIEKIEQKTVTTTME
ncbi:Imm3 family immunity protein [Gorillibacterium sp. CAU 1737]|uniref:Imm3 family immunity protein n=1 Tax=Gorillibacterium sp. CAU 1737 TaxID=3140362 RepID=UPI003260FED8